MAHSTARGGSLVPYWPRMTATRVKLSPTSNPAGAGMIVMPPTDREGPLIAPDARVRGAGLLGVADPVSVATVPDLIVSVAATNSRNGSRELGWSSLVAS